MADFLNPGTDMFQRSLRSRIYVDKSGLIGELNDLVETEDCFVCVSRPRRFGKTMALKMLGAYYGMGEDAYEYFKDLKISSYPSFEKHLNQYHCLMINMQDFLTETDSVEEMIDDLQKSLIHRLVAANPTIEFEDKSKIVRVMNDIYRQTKRSFVILIDEWDCIFRVHKTDDTAQGKFLDFLRLWLKDKPYVGLAYMTGILPIKKYGTHSALNMFEEYSMTDPHPFIDYFGFTSFEVEKLCQRFNVSIEEMKYWYNGYFIETGTPIFNPRSVVQSLSRGKFNSYWNKTETYEALKVYIQMNMDGLRDKVVRLLSGDCVEVNTKKFKNDMSTFHSADDVLSLLVHLGYLSFDFESSRVRIPNEEVKMEFVNVIEDLEWPVLDSLKAADALLRAIWEKDTLKVASLIQAAHEKNTSILNYNNENALGMIIRLALYTASGYYTEIRELPTGKGFADIVYLPRPKHLDKPAMIVELKWDKSAVSAIDQIKEKNYVGALDAYQGNLLLVGINYDKASKEHECVIEKFMM